MSNFVQIVILFFVVLGIINQTIIFFHQKNSFSHYPSILNYQEYVDETNKDQQIDYDDDTDSEIRQALFEEEEDLKLKIKKIKRRQEILRQSKRIGEEKISQEVDDKEAWELEKKKITEDSEKKLKESEIKQMITRDIERQTVTMENQILLNIKNQKQPNINLIDEKSKSKTQLQPQLQPQLQSPSKTLKEKDYEELIRSNPWEYKDLKISSYCEPFLRRAGWFDYKEGEDRSGYLSQFIDKNDGRSDDHEIWSFKNCIILPHCLFWSSQDLYAYKYQRDGFSQDGQDRYLVKNIFRHKSEGVFIEIGAFDGISASNTLLFEECYHWRGISVEPHPWSSSQLIKLKKSSETKVVTNCIAGFNGESEFLVASTLSGIPQYFTEQHKERIKREMGDQPYNISIECITIYDLILKFSDYLKYDPTLNDGWIEDDGEEDKEEDKDILKIKIDYMSLDIEGAELDSLITFFNNLKSNPKVKISVDVISAENTYGDDRLHKLMSISGYTRLKNVGVDQIYVRNQMLPFIVS